MFHSSQAGHRPAPSNALGSGPAALAKAGVCDPDRNSGAHLDEITPPQVEITSTKLTSDRLGSDLQHPHPPRNLEHRTGLTFPCWCTGHEAASEAVIILHPLVPVRTPYR